MSQTNLGTYSPNTWCPGCGNFAILNGIKTVLNELKDTAFPLENVVIVTGDRLSCKDRGLSQRQQFL